MAEDRKYSFVTYRDGAGAFVNRVSGEAIPDDEPVIIFRARDRHALAMLEFYRAMVVDPHHAQAVEERILDFRTFRAVHPDRMKEPGIGKHIKLNAPL